MGGGPNRIPAVDVSKFCREAIKRFPNQSVARGCSFVELVPIFEANPEDLLRKLESFYQLAILLTVVEMASEPKKLICCFSAVSGDTLRSTSS